jgi:ribosomal protein S18 acetylase RimI-like enzyme
MEVRRFTEKDMPEVLALFNNAVSDKEMIYKPLNEEMFATLFYKESEIISPVVTVGVEDGKIIGFAAGNTSAELDKAYITYVGVAKTHRRKGYGRKLLSELEIILQEKNNGIKKFEIVFFNPANLTWVIPETSGHDHPNAPGVDMQSSAYLFFKNNGYRDFAYQNVYYLELKHYLLPADMKARLKQLEEKELHITTYRPDLHQGFDELFDNLASEDWRTRITDNIKRPDGGDPVLILEHKGKICGFTGPLSVQESGRGYFAGIGVHSDYRGHGAGKVMFASLCIGLKEIGAQFMTLFTGENNPARNIYEAAGFKIVKSFADMRKVAH